MSVQNKFCVGDRVEWSDYGYWLGFHKEDVGFEDILTVLGYVGVHPHLVELKSDKRVVIRAFDWRFELVEDAPKVQDNSWYEKGELPPVGTVCEAWYMGRDQGVVEVRYSGECMVLWSVSHKHEQCSLSKNYIFRPIKSPEQIAKQEREAYCDRIYAVLCKAERKNNLSDMAEALYDAGLRFVGEDK